MCLNADRKGPEEKEWLNVQVREEPPRRPGCEKTRWNSVEEGGGSQRGEGSPSPEEEMARGK